MTLGVVRFVGGSASDVPDVPKTARRSSYRLGPAELTISSKEPAANSDTGIAMHREPVAAKCILWLIASDSCCTYELARSFTYWWVNIHTAICTTGLLKAIWIMESGLHFLCLRPHE